ncbi:phosphate ABC transporter permease subunit PstC [Hyphobacterium sp. HN65]|uniref:Phosphate transport system permease protein n=1 Tax=Hyphobacterium lacteum TaxID=3116575 RepID=A0ABU7LNG1_9PROT|nr:phosphate ABC transporter permease subunit PstC [Hyphobacterium sp. HN65]MEE2525458.1 phosphate ABC transporter permease subunit PstC [Hyphobacterium sp. HN65]
MPANALLLLMMLVLISAAFYLGRSRALRSSPGGSAALHSLPNYHGYFVALWTGFPALLLIALIGLFGATATSQIVESRLTAAATPLVEIYDARLAEDSGAISAREAIALGGEPASISRARTQLAERQSAIAAEVEQMAESEGYRPLARAGFHFHALPRERRQLFMSDARALAFNGQPSEQTAELEAAADVFRPVDQSIRYGGAILAIILALAGLFWSRSRVQAGFRARNKVESAFTAALVFCSAIAILTTIGIIASLLFESLRFFEAIDWRIDQFLFGTQWSPQIAIRADQVGQSGAFGAVPLFAGTFMITVIAMLVAGPIGLFSAIYLSEYAGKRTRNIVKPVMEILAGIPTVVYGFFALLTVGPAIRAAAQWVGFEGAVTQSALSAGLVMGVMIIPFVSSLSDDVINAVPQSLRDGAYAMGATRSETVQQVVIPAALPGIVGALLLAVSRAVGETMIVVMAAGQGANLTANPLESVTTITVQIVMLLTGDQEFDSAKTLSAFALGLVLFMFTLALNVVALRVVQKYREKYE